MQLFDSWEQIGGAVANGVLYYLFIVVAIRLVGKRAVSRMNNFDWIVTVAVGAIAGATILSVDVSLAEGVGATSALLALQFGLTKLSTKSVICANLLYGKPTLLFYEGRFLDDALEKQRVTRAEVHAAVRVHGGASMDEVRAVVFEYDARLSVIFTSSDAPLDLLEHVDRPDNVAHS